MSGKKSVISTNHFARASCWWVCSCAPHLWFVHLPNWHFSLHLPPLQRPDICTVDNFQRFRLFSLPTSSQEISKQESTFTFTFILQTIYEVNGTAQYLERCWPATNNDAILTLYLIHNLSLTLSCLLQASNKLIHRTIEPSIHWSIHRSNNRTISQSIEWSIHQSFDPLIHRSFDQSIHPAIHPLIHPSSMQSIYPLINLSIDRSIDPSIDQCIDRSIYSSINPSNHPSIDVDWSINPSIKSSINP